MAASLQRMSSSFQGLEMDAISPLPVNFSTLSLLEGQDVAVVNSPSFKCDGEGYQEIVMTTNEKVRLHALGFLGPIKADSFYDVTVEIERRYNSQETYSSGLMKRRLFARKGQVFHFVFDQPIIIQPSANADDESLPSDPYTIRFSLNGPKTSSFQRKFMSKSTLVDGETKFVFCWLTKQFAEFQFTRF